MASVLLTPLQILKEPPLAGLVCGLAGGLGQLCPLSLFPVLRTESFLAEGPRCVLDAKAVFFSENSPFIFNSRYQDLVLFACLAPECGQLRRTHAISEHGSCLSGISH